ncbi:MAG: T9SS type A sorting domain-containing protein [Ignavibacteria bacterium]|nr:T9SS type A sorting domain-containing protein [Ignavibacteria bacterium]
MKIFYFIFGLLFFFVSEACRADYFEFQVTGTTNTLRSITFTDQNTGICVGGSSTILRTSNGGTNWFNIDVSTSTAYYTCVAFANATTAFVTSDSGQLVKTTNGGLNWTISNFSSGPLKYVYFLNSTLGFIGGANSTLYKTTNGGVNWTNISLGAPEPITRINFLDENFGLLITRQNLDSACIYKTTNGGLNWQILNNIFLGYIGEKALFDCVPLSRDTIYVSLGYYQTGILRTTNGGANWQYIYNQFQTITYPGTLYELFFIDRSTLMAMNGPTDGAPCYLIKSTNGGFNFTHPSAIRLSGYMYDGFFFRNSNSAYFCGESGRIVKLYSYLTNIKQETEPAIVPDNFIIAPNPVGNTLNIKFLNETDNTASDYNLKIFDSSGREVKSFSVSNNQTQLNISSLPRGVYFVSVSGEGRKYFYKKFLKIY